MSKLTNEQLYDALMAAKKKFESLLKEANERIDNDHYFIDFLSGDGLSLVHGLDSNVVNKKSFVALLDNPTGNNLKEYIHKRLY